MELPDLTKSRDSLHFRLWTNSQAIDIWTNDYKIFNGMLSNHTKSETTDKFYSNKTPINPATAKEIYKLFKAKLIFQIPTDGKIKGWSPVSDGEAILVEYSTKEFYSFKEYDTPSMFKNIKEAVTLDKLEKELEAILNMNKSWGTFLNGLPKGCYRVSQYVACNDKEKSN
jgi:hypothetical protein